MCSCLDPMVQDTPEQDIVVEEQEPPQTDPEPEMAAVYDTSPPLLRNPPPIPAETAQPSAFDIILQAMDAHTQAFINDVRALRGEMRQVGQCLRADKMAAPRAGTNELEGSAPAGEDRVLRATCRARKATEKVTQGEKLIGVTETCTRERKEQVRRKARLRYAEIVEEQGVKQGEGRERLIERARMTYVRIRERRQREAETSRHKERLHGTDGVVGDTHTRTHTHTGSEGQWG